MHACVCESCVKSFHCMVYTVIVLALLSFVAFVSCASIRVQLWHSSVCAFVLLFRMCSVLHSCHWCRCHPLATTARKHYKRGCMKVIPYYLLHIGRGLRGNNLFLQIFLLFAPGTGGEYQDKWLSPRG